MKIFQVVSFQEGWWQRKQLPLRLFLCCCSSMKWGNVMFKLKWAALKCISAASVFSGCFVSRVAPHCSVSSSFQALKVFLKLWLQHIERSHTQIWHDLYKHCFLTLAWSSLVLLRMKSFFFPHLICVLCPCLLGCELLRVHLCCHEAVPTSGCWAASLAVGNSSVTLDLSEIQPREMLRNYLFNPRKLFLFEVNWLKRFWFAAALETVCYDLDFFFFLHIVSKVPWY